MKARSYRRKYKYPRRRPFFKKRAFWNLVFVFVFLGFGVYFLFYSQVFKIKRFEILTSDNYLRREIHNFLIKKTGANFFLINSGSIEKEILKKYPEVEKVSVNKKFPESLILNIEKRIPVGVFCFSDKSCFLIDKEGVIFETSETQKDPKLQNLPMIFFAENENFERGVGERVVSSETIDKILRIKKRFQKLSIDTEKFVLKKTQRLDVETKEGWEVYFDLNKDLGLTLTKLTLLLEKEISRSRRKSLQYIDLRFSKVYYK